MTTIPPERRQSTLTETDFSRIADSFDERMSTLFETIGYDTSTAEARKEIRADHEFVRDTRKAKGVVVYGILLSVGTGIAVWMGAHFLGSS